MCYHVKSGSSETKGVCTNIKEPQNYGALGHRPHELDAWLITQNKPIPGMYYYVKFGSSATKDVRTNRKEPKNGERCDPAKLGWGMADRLKRSPACVLASQIW